MSTTPVAAKVHVSPEFITSQRDLLGTERDRIVRSLAEIDAEIANLADSGGVTEIEFSEEGGEGSAAAVDAERVRALHAQLSSRLMDLDLALGRLDRGTYGICEACRGPVGQARLEAMPEATLCVACKTSPWTARRLSR